VVYAPPLDHEACCLKIVEEMNVLDKHYVLEVEPRESCKYFLQIWLLRLYNSFFRTSRNDFYAGLNGGKLDSFEDIILLLNLTHLNKNHFIVDRAGQKYYRL
jgi:hypothetical protein